MTSMARRERESPGMILVCKELASEIALNDGYFPRRSRYFAVYSYHNFHTGRDGFLVATSKRQVTRTLPDSYYYPRLTKLWDRRDGLTPAGQGAFRQ